MCFVCFDEYFSLMTYLYERYTWVQEILDLTNPDLTGLGFKELNSLVLPR
jgi:hypothetical protein